MLKKVLRLLRQNTVECFNPCDCLIYTIQDFEIQPK